MATSRNYSELEMVWKGWRDNSGRRMKDKYAKFVDLSNQAIQDLNQGTYHCILVERRIPFLASAL